ncbi:flagellar hook-associated protein FlgL [Vulcaniibacterium tengchongense]|uniref:Flagellar hook-associated protein 3 FlgL n=1 Tax=Vulcaniibacterium tengchongense TaxID=1273429 RepID=A0A3N4VH90_9GAMM|nr:flagellar hook-associated protein FlgL [Vulcaniibacterium tengchongense]RPE80875.1 flagellar hook-associated protein 3 FlgL [Vulcaniibacterium tengchongense]
MNPRISTGNLYQQSLGAMLRKQSALAHTQQQLASGRRLVTAKDDPVAAGTAVGLDRALAELTRYGENANLLQNRLNLQENVLAQAGDNLARVRELAVQANNASLSSEDKQAITAELEVIRKELLGLANSQDGSGRYLFGGTADDRAPFALSGGTALYNGDQTRRRVEVAPDLLVDDTLPGSELFMRVRTGDGRLDAQADPANAGGGVLLDFGLDAAGNWNGQRYAVVFTAADAYEVRDGAGTVVASGAYASGDSIVAAGLHLRIEGEPAAGDIFAIGPAGQRDVFATVDRLIAALGMPDDTPAQRAAQQNLLQSSLRDVATAQEHLVDGRAAAGAQLAALDGAGELREAQSLAFETTLSNLRDLDYAEAISRFSIESAALQAAQGAFVRLQSSTLFDLLR